MEQPTTEEIVDLYAQDEVPGRVTGTESRSTVRARNLPHAAVKILLRDAADRVYVHRRTESKDLYPGLIDVWIGGVITAGEVPLPAAERELAEELGLRGCALSPVARRWYTDAHTNYLAHLYETRHDPDVHGPIVHQRSEIADGWWLPWHELMTRLNDPDWPFVPDGRSHLTHYAHGGRPRSAAPSPPLG
ncbi:NUDIX domain-containing protein (plasmid) [Streptomyces clavuligerus]|uniref:NUDIX hydrolase n=1 Tax=Streptomyces clavuligerus TaxID=1901 RepID=B5GN08_STRCL|nr:NUDIX domain-containing protein [Streptomyces clavuligerus]ANW22236.1 NUDIX hydrolase [Streptomyces clavuligerus]AXU17132.1 NUDIX domain-containing protein [Streptomyces clavuligerus]EDY47704.1 NUDIX hydrolase [Streptomyces clavuligerus]EFG04303.1 NUDIX hydrolase [Streptomyces clavuligerus]MBY6307222.1 NUDIX domain-containing protein [Streptomyces clavuligerus]